MDAYQTAKCDVMKPTKKKRLRLVGEKYWTRAELESSRENFDFVWAKDWPFHHLPIAWAWELDRELGSENPPFIVAWKKKFGDAKPVEEIEPAAAIFHLDGDEVRDLYPINPNGYLPAFGGGEFYYYALKVNLRRGEDEILADLKEEKKNSSTARQLLDTASIRGACLRARITSHDLETWQSTE